MRELIAITALITFVASLCVAVDLGYEEGKAMGVRQVKEEYERAVAYATEQNVEKHKRLEQKLAALNLEYANAMEKLDELHTKNSLLVRSLHFERYMCRPAKTSLPEYAAAIDSATARLRELFESFSEQATATDKAIALSKYAIGVSDAFRAYCG